MITQKPSKPTPLPGITATLKAGFEVTTKHWWIAILPALLDMFYWLGPRLSPYHLVEQAMSFLTNQAMLAEMNQQLLTTAQQTNLFANLTIPFIGVPTLMRLIPPQTPIVTQTIEIQNFGVWFGLLMAISIVGFLLTAFYFTLIAQAVKRPSNGRPPLKTFIRHVLSTWVYLIMVGMGVLLASLIIFFPLMILSTLLSLITPQLVILVLISGMMFIFWLAVFLGFTPHGLTLNNRPLTKAVWESVQLVRLNYISTITLLLAIAGITMVMDQLMHYADDGSWFTLSSIIGHAFVSTALVAASYVFYQDRIAIQWVAQRQTMPIDQIEETSNG